MVLQGKRMEMSRPPACFLDRLRALKAGARDFISKPFDQPELMVRIRNMLEVRLLHRMLRERNKTILEANEHLLIAALDAPVQGVAL